MNVEGIFFGKLDPRSEWKWEESRCKKAGDILKKYGYDAIYSSDLLRASETAELINYLKLSIKFDKRLQEIDLEYLKGWAIKR